MSAHSNRGFSNFRFLSSALGADAERGASIQMSQIFGRLPIRRRRRLSKSRPTIERNRATPLRLRYPQAMNATKTARKVMRKPKSREDERETPGGPSLPALLFAMLPLLSRIDTVASISESDGTATAFPRLMMKPGLVADCVDKDAI